MACVAKSIFSMCLRARVPPSARFSTSLQQPEVLLAGQVSYLYGRPEFALMNKAQSGRSVPGRKQTLNGDLHESLLFTDKLSLIVRLVVANARATCNRLSLRDLHDFVQNSLQLHIVHAPYARRVWRFCHRTSVEFQIPYTCRQMFSCW